MISDLPWDEINFYANKYDLDKNHIAACIMTESNGNQYAARYEPSWKYMYFPRNYADKLGITLETEQSLQCTSYGLMQIMGSVCRELGFNEHLPILYTIQSNLDMGCNKLKQLLKKCAKIEEAISAYNAGNVRRTDGGFFINQPHVDRFCQWLEKLERP